MTDMAALAARYPTVAADLQAAGLTATQHDAYRVALISALVGRGTPKAAGVADPHSVLAQNMEFLRTHMDEVRTLARAGIRDPEHVGLNGGVIAYGWSLEHWLPEDVNAVGPMGIWRTP
jgi:hypothetical protein